VGGDWDLERAVQVVPYPIVAVSDPPLDDGARRAFVKGRLCRPGEGRKRGYTLDDEARHSVIKGRFGCFESFRLSHQKQVWLSRQFWLYRPGIRGDTWVKLICVPYHSTQREMWLGVPTSTLKP